MVDHPHDDFGALVSEFFIALTSQQLDLAISTLNIIESMEKDPVQTEIAEHLQRRVIQDVKSEYITRINALANRVRKEMKAKSCNHVKLLLEVLGESSSLLNDALPALHTLIYDRTIDLMELILQTFYEDKNIAQWYARIQQDESLNLQVTSCSPDCQMY